MQAEERRGEGRRGGDAAPAEDVEERKAEWSGVGVGGRVGRQTHASLCQRDCRKETRAKVKQQ